MQWFKGDEPLNLSFLFDTLFLVYVIMCACVCGYVPVHVFVMVKQLLVVGATIWIRRLWLQSPHSETRISQSQWGLFAFPSDCTDFESQTHRYYQCKNHRCCQLKSHWCLYMEKWTYKHTRDHLMVPDIMHIYMDYKNKYIAKTTMGISLLSQQICFLQRYTKSRSHVRCKNTVLFNNTFWGANHIFSVLSLIRLAAGPGKTKHPFTTSLTWFDVTSPYESSHKPIQIHCHFTATQ